MECIFCKIANKELPSNISYEDEHVLAFDDVNPQAPVHKLIIPRKHIASLNHLTETDNQLIGHIFQVTKKIAQDLKIADDGFRVVNNCNANAGQTVFHIHFHLLGGRQMNWPPG